MKIVRSEMNNRGHDLFVLALLSVIAGIGTGSIVSIFILTLDWLSQVRHDLLLEAHRLPVEVLALVVIGCAGSATVAAWIVRKYSRYASGSGVPEVEAALNGVLPPAPLRRILLIKYVGGILSIGSGMMLGPEGPGVQMGAVGARLIGAVFRRSWLDTRALIAAGAGAGIAVAFNAPIAGTVFALEELVRRFDAKIAIAGLGASSAAILVARLLLGIGPDYHVVINEHRLIVIGEHSYASIMAWLLYAVLGALSGLVAVYYNKFIIGALSFTDRLSKCPVELKAAMIGAIIGVVGWFSPDLIGAGDNIMQRMLIGGTTASGILGIFVIRYILSGVCYAARTPGGLFAPLLTLGALGGLFFGKVIEGTFPNIGIEPQVFAVVGMAAFFVGVVRAPVTAIVLVIEMTSAFKMLLPILVACFTAMLSSTMLNSPPIYASLRQRLSEELARDTS